MNDIQTAEKQSASQKRYNKMKAVRDLLHPLTYDCLTHWTTEENPNKTSGQIGGMVAKLLIPSEKNADFIGKIFKLDKEVRDFANRVRLNNVEVVTAFSYGVRPTQPKVSIINEILEQHKEEIAQ